MNLLIQKGNITRDLELEYTPKGTAVLTLGLAVNRKWRTENGEMKEEVTFTDWRAWGKQAETLVKFFSKGKPILLKGRLTQEEWTDKETQKKRRKSLGIVEEFEFCGGESRPVAEPPGGHPAGRIGGQPRPAAPDAPLDGSAPEDDDIPF
jgi:single-strand DNA-binding protein